MKAVILAAGVGSRLRPFTDNAPKALAPVAGRPIMAYAIEAFAKTGISEVIVVTGHLREQVQAFIADSPIPTVEVYNPRYATANNYYSLLVAEEALGGEGFVKVDSDLVFQAPALSRILAAEADLALAMDTAVDLADEEMKIQLGPEGQVVGCSKLLDPAVCSGESIGMEKISQSFAPTIFDELRAMDKEGLTDDYYEDAYHRLAQRGGHDLRAVDVAGLPWSEVDDADDLARADALFGG